MMLPDDYDDYDRPATAEDLRRLCDLFIHHLIAILENPEATASQLNVVRAFLHDQKISFRSGHERAALDSLIESWERDNIVPFIDPITRRRY